MSEKNFKTHYFMILIASKKERENRSYWLISFLNIYSAIYKTALENKLMA